MPTSSDRFAQTRTIPRLLKNIFRSLRSPSTLPAPPYEALLSDPDWLPEEFKQPSGNTTMGDGIASLLLYRSDLRDLSLSTLVVAPGLATPVHNHLAAFIFWRMISAALFDRNSIPRAAGRSHFDPGGATHRAKAASRRSGIFEI